MPAGRPSKYNEALLEKANHYLDNWEAMGHKIPSNSSLCLHLEITRETVQDWRNDPKKPEFSYILARISLMQETTLLDKGLANEYNSNLCKLVLGKHGYTDKQELTGGEGGPLNVRINNHFPIPDVDHGDDDE